MTDTIKTRITDISQVKPGDKVLIATYRDKHITYTVSETVGEYIFFTDRTCEWLVTGPDKCYLVTAQVSNEPARPSAPQSRLVLDLLSKGHPLSRVTAMHYGIMNLTARLADLRNAGWHIICTNKRDHKGNRYGSFKLAVDQLPLAA